MKYRLTFFNEKEQGKILDELIDILCEDKISEPYINNVVGMDMYCKFYFNTSTTCWLGYDTIVKITKLMATYRCSYKLEKKVLFFWVRV